MSAKGALADVRWHNVARGLQPGDPRLIGPYRLVGRLGCGGMGQVFLGLSAGGRPVAVKAIRAELAERGVKVSYDAVWRFFLRAGLSFKKKPARQRARPA